MSWKPEIGKPALESAYADIGNWLAGSVAAWKISKNHSAPLGRELAVGGGSMCVSSDRELALPSSGVRSGAIEATRVGARLHAG